jgi:CheY-like chemotaxis protein
VELVADSLRRLREAPRGAEEWDEAAQALDDALEGAERMRVILRDLRTLARPDDHSDGAADVGALLEYAAALASNEIRPRARLVWEVGDVPPVRGGEGRLGQVFVNLLVNAAHATPEGNPGAHVIKLSARRRPDGKVEIAVQDSGAGIPAENLAKVFDPFFTTKPVGLGTGLGLWVCQSIVNAAGGVLEVESEVGRGTTFRVVLPAAPPGTCPSAGARRADARGRGGARSGRALRKVLVVDDEPLVAATVRRQLAADFTVESASGPADALARVLAGGFDAVVCDVMFEGATGLDVVEVIRAADPALGDRVLLMSGGAPAAVSERIARLGAKVLAKPFGGRQLREALRELIG